MQTETAFPTTPLLRPDQVESTRGEISALEEKLKNRYIEDKGEVQRQLTRVRKDFETQVPRPPETKEEEDRMAKRAKQLLSEITQGMCSQEEMRKNPPGAVDKHRHWEARNKLKIAEWKHIMLRITAGSGDRDAANIERYRPVASTLNMDSAQIRGKQIYLPEYTTGPGVTFTEEQINALRMIAPEVADRLATLTNSQRADVKNVMDGIGLEPSVASAAGKLGVERREAKKARKPMSEERKAALIKRLEAARAAKAAKKE